MKKIMFLAIAMLLLGGATYSKSENLSEVPFRQPDKNIPQKDFPYFLGSYIYNGIEYNFEGYDDNGYRYISGVFYIQGGLRVDVYSFSGTWGPPTAPGAISYVSARVYPTSSSGYFDIAQDIY